MNEEKFVEIMRNMRLMKSSDSNFSSEKFIDLTDLSEDQKNRLEREFGKKKKVWMENSLFYNYYENDSF